MQKYPPERPFLEKTGQFPQIHILFLSIGQADVFLAQYIFSILPLLQSE